MKTQFQLFNFTKAVLFGFLAVAGVSAAVAWRATTVAVATVQSDNSSEILPVITDIDAVVVSGNVPQPSSCLAAQFLAGPKTNIPSYGLPTLLADFNGDGQLDVARPTNFVNNTPTELVQFYGDGKGGFSNAGTFLFYNLIPQTFFQWATDLNHDGKADLIGRVQSDSVITIMLGNGDGTFSAPRNYRAGGEVQMLEIGDFNNDSHLDIAANCYDSDGGRDIFSQVSLLLGDGHGNLGYVSDTPLFTYAYFLTQGDFNNDKKLDVAMGSRDGARIWFGDGRWGFSHSVLIPVQLTDYNFPRITSADFDGDGNEDLLVSEAYAPGVVFLKGNGQGGFTTIQRQLEKPPNAEPRVADFNVDGLPDLVVFEYNEQQNEKRLVTYLNTGGFEFCAQPLPGVGGYGLIGKINLDNKDDLLITEGSPLQTFYALLNQTGNSSNTPPTITLPPSTTIQGSLSIRTFGTVSDAETAADKLQLSAGILPLGVWFENFGNVGGAVKTDLFTSCSVVPGTYQIPITVTDAAGLSTTANWTLTITPNQPPMLGTYANTTVSGSTTQVVPSRRFSDDVLVSTWSVTSPTYTGTISLDQNGVVTITNNNVAGSYVGTIRVQDNCGLTSTSSFTFTIVPPDGCNGQVPGFIASVNYPIGGSASDLTTGDFNNDGVLDVAVANFDAISVSILLGNGTGGFLPATQHALASGRGRLSVGDFNRDGNLDVVATNHYSNTVSVLLGKGNGDFSGAVHYVVKDYPDDLVVGDFNSDGNLDVVVQTREPDTISLLLGDGRGALGAATPFAVPTNGGRIAVADLNRDNKLDLIVSGQTANKVSFLLGDGAGQFRLVAEQAVELASEFTASDFNRDGVVDLAVLDKHNNRIVVMPGKGDGTFLAGVSYAAPNILLDISAADLNGDGTLDIVASISAETNNIAILAGIGNGSFHPLAFASMGAYPGYFTTGDFNRDGRVDLVVGNNLFPHQGVTLMRNVGTCSGVNTPPRITPASAVTLLRKQTANSIPIAVVSDAETLAGDLFVSATKVPTGIQIVNIINKNGAITADLAVLCGATVGRSPIELTVVDTKGGSAKTEFIVNVTASQMFAPERVTIAAGMGTEFFPGVLNGGFNTSQFSVSPSFTGKAGYFGPPGTFRISSAGPVGTHAVTFTHKDDCGQETSAVVTIVVTGETPDCKFPAYQKSANTNVSAFTSAITSDFNNDGKPDLALFGYNNQVQILPGDGRGGFSAGSAVSVGTLSGFGRMTAGDFDGDGDQDIFVQPGFATSQPTLGVLINNGRGQFILQSTSYIGLAAPTADFNNDGRMDLFERSSFRDPATNTLYFTYIAHLNNGNGTFRTVTTSDPLDRVIGPYFFGDFNGDGNVDLAARVPYVEGLFSLYGKGNGEFVRGGIFGTSNTVQHILTAADFNKDRRSDLIIIAGYPSEGGTTNGMEVLKFLGTSHVGFAPGLTGVPADYNGDGHLDILLSDGRIALQDGSQSICAAPGGYPFSSLVADFDSDGKADILTPVFKPAPNGEDSISTQLDFYLSGNNSSNTPPAITLFDASYQQADPGGIYEFGSVRDQETMWRELKLEVIAAPPGVFVTNPFSNDGAVRATVRVDCSASPGVNLVKLRVTDGGGLSATADWRLTVLPNAVPELGSYPNTQTVSINQTAIIQPSTPLRDNSGIVPAIIATAPTFQGAIKVDSQGNVTVNNASPVGNHMFTVTATDDCGAKTVRTFTLVVTSDAGTGCSTPIFSAPGNVAVGNNPYGLASGDINGDKRMDLITTNLWDNTITPLYNNGNGFTKGAPIAVGILPNYIAARDLNDDTRLDLVVVNRGSDTVTILLGNGTGFFTKKGDYQVGNKSTGVTIGDFNRDGKLDLALPNDGLGNVAILNGNGDGSFNLPRYVYAGDSPQPGVVADFNKDGIPDLAFPNYNSGNVVVLLGLSFGGFNGALIFNTGTGAGLEAIAVGDLDGDGNPDLAMTNTTTNVVTTLRGDGRGQFAPGGGFATFSNYPAAMVIADFTGDGKADIAVGGYNDDAVRVFKGLGNGFDNNNPTTLKVGSYPLSLLTNDFNGDGKPDLAVANNGSGTVSALLNGCVK